MIRLSQLKRKCQIFWYHFVPSKNNKFQIPINCSRIWNRYSALIILIPLILFCSFQKRRTGVTATAWTSFVGTPVTLTCCPRPRGTKPSGSGTPGSLSRSPPFRQREKISILVTLWPSKIALLTISRFYDVVGQQWKHIDLQYL